MAQSQRIVHEVKNENHIHALMDKHADLDKRIAQECKNPGASSYLIRELKARRLRIKEEIEEYVKNE
jgi:hypothetical protein